MSRRTWLKHLGFTTTAAIAASKINAMSQSNEPTIEQMNEAIGLFDGWRSYSEHLIDEYKINISQGRCSKIEDMKYHTSWDWLMPVGKKIRDLLQDMLKKRPPHTACHGDLIEVDIHCAISEYDLRKAYKYIHQFITWYNQQTTTNDTE